MRDRDPAHATLAPVGEHVDAFFEITGRAVEFPYKEALANFRRKKTT